MNYEEIIARIQKGEDPEAIVKEFTDNINKAQKEVAAAKEEAAKNEAKSQKMDQISVAIAHALNEYARLAGIEEFEALRGAEVRDLLDKFLPVMESIKDIKVYTTKTTPKKVKSIKASKPEDVFNWFFSELGI